MESAEFLVLLEDRQGNETLARTNVVPLIPGHACYGWRIRLSEELDLVHFREVFSLPEEPEFWTGEGDEFEPNEISSDRRISITEKFVTPKDRTISNSWCVVNGDPEGKHSMEVFIDGEFVKRFEFELKKVPDIMGGDIQ